MTDERIKQHMDDIAIIAHNASVIETLQLMSQYISSFHAHKDDESLIKMNYCMIILLVKQGLINTDEATTDISFVMKQREMFDTIKNAKQ
jgi:hypothetical protein